MENLTNWCVYMHENRVNGKKYIGITSQKPTRRWKNGRHYEQCTAFFRAIQKYGWDGFRHEILFTDLRQEEAERLEVELIAKYQTQDPEHGYNLASGGSARSGWHHTEEAKEKIGARTRGTHLTEEHKARIGAAQTGQKNHNFGKTLSCAQKTKISEALLGHPVSQETRQKIREQKTRTAGRQVICSSTGNAYPSVAMAAEKTGINRTSILGCCKGTRKTAGGFRWEYDDDAVTGE